MSHFSRIKTRMVERQHLLAALRDLGHTPVEGDVKARGFFGDKADQLTLLLDLFRPLNTDRAEIVATLYAAWNDFLGPWIMLMSEQGRWPLSVALYKLQASLMNWQPSQRNT